MCFIFVLGQLFSHTGLYLRKSISSLFAVLLSTFYTMELLSRPYSGAQLFFPRMIPWINASVVKSRWLCYFQESTLCSKKSDAEIQITITMAHLIRINYPLSSFNYCLSGTKVANFKKIRHTVSEQQLLKNGTQKQNFPIWKIPIRILTAESVTNDIIFVTFLWRVCLA